MNPDHKHRRRRQPWPDSPVLALILLQALAPGFDRTGHCRRIKARIRDIRRRARYAARLASC